MQSVYNFSSRRMSLFNLLSTNLKLILVNVVAFILFSILIRDFSSPCGETFCRYVAISPSNILGGNYLWTFVTSIFMHGSLFHLFANMISLFFIGGIVEKILGSKRYLTFYLASGLFAGLFFVLSTLFFPADLNTFAVGASGAIFALVGLLILMTPDLPVYVMFIPIPIKMKYAGPGILVLLWIISLAGNIPIGNMAHLGGLIAGVGYGVYLRRKYKRKVMLIGRHFSNG